MRVLDSTIAIDADPEQVWAVLTDFAAYPEWNPFLTAIEGSADVGARLSVRFAPPGGRAMTMKPTVTASEPSRRFAWLGHLGVPHVFDGAHEFILEPNGHGGTSLTQRETFGGVLVPFTGRLLERTGRGFAAMNEALKVRVESVTGAPTPATPLPCADHAGPRSQ